MENQFAAFVIGVILGMGFNFMMARVFVFKPLNESIEKETRHK